MTRKGGVWITGLNSVPAKAAVALARPEATSNAKAIF